MAAEAERIMARDRQLRERLMAAVAGATPQEMNHHSDGRWPARAILVHIGNWEEEAVTYLDCLVNGKPFPADDSKGIDDWNAKHLAKYAGLDAVGAVAYMEEAHQRMAAGVSLLTDEQITANPRLIPLLLMTPDHITGHLHQVIEALALARGDRHTAAVAYLDYARERVLTRLNLEYRPAGSLLWRPSPEAWSIQDVLIHLTVWDSYFAGWMNARADGLPEPASPYAEGGLDEWNREQVAARRYWSLACTLSAMGAARSQLLAAIRRLSQEQIAAEDVQAELKGYREHDDHHMHQILRLLQGWRESQQ